MADQGFHEIQLSGKHLVALFMAATVVAVVIFLCGVMVGRDISAQRVALAQAVSEASPTDPTAEARPQPDTDQPPAAAAGSSGTSTPAPSQETLSYPERLAGTSAPAETLKPAPTPAPEKGLSIPIREIPRRPTPDAPNARNAPAASNAPDASSGSGFTVQVAAVAERGEADAIARRLATKGYAAYVTAPAAGAPRVFRVRVGKYKDRRAAQQIADRLQKEEQFKPWITR